MYFFDNSTWVKNIALGTGVGNYCADKIFANDALAQVSNLNFEVNCTGTLCRHRENLWRSEEHTSELQSRFDLVCRLLLEIKNEFSFDETYRLFDYVLKCK